MCVDSSCWPESSSAQLRSEDPIGLSPLEMRSSAKKTKGREMMSFRRFVYLVTDDVRRRNFSLRRIDMSRFFLPKGQRDGDPPQLEAAAAAELPQPEVHFAPPTCVVQDLQFMLFPSGDGSRNDDDKVVVSDLTGRVLLYDTESRSIRTMPSFTAPKFAPVSMAAAGDNSHYVLNTNFTLSNHTCCCFDRFSFSHDDDWRCRSRSTSFTVAMPCLRAWRRRTMQVVVKSAW